MRWSASFWVLHVRLAAPLIDTVGPPPIPEGALGVAGSPIDFRVSVPENRSCSLL